MKSLLVGSHFHPPAKAILEALPAGTPLTLLAEPENPYDSNAILVHLSPADVPTSAYAGLESSLPGFGMSLDELLRTDFVVMGHVAASGNKNLKNTDLQCNLDFHKAITEWPAGASLGFDGDGKPLVELFEQSL